MQRRRAAALLAGLCALSAPAAPQESIPPEGSDLELYTPITRVAAEGALRWLAARQNADGSWNAFIGFKINDGYRVQPADQGMDGLPHIGVTSLAGMAFLSGGHLPGQGPYGETVAKALDFVVRNVGEEGYVTHLGSRMYSHAFSVLFLAEAFGMTGRRDLREALDRSVEFTYKSQNEKGGWRYVPNARDSDMSITVCQVVALREARNIGIRVPKATIDKALKYVLESAITYGEDKGAFLYQELEVPFNRNSFALTAAGLTTVFQAGLYTDDQVYRYCRERNLRRQPDRLVGDCMAYLWETYPGVAREYRNHYFYFYGNYYAMQAMYTRGGDEWRRWYAMVRDDLLQSARRISLEGGETGVSWRCRHVGDTFATSVAAIILQVPTHYLPIFQR